MRVSNEKVVQAFFQGQEALSHRKNFSSHAGYLDSYSTSVAKLLADESILVRSQDECLSATTSAHANKAFLAAVRKGDARWAKGARVHWEQLEAWGLSPEDITSAKEDRNGGVAIEVNKDFWLYHPSPSGAPCVQPLLERYVRPVHLGTWFKLDRCPLSSLHFARSVLGDQGWQRCLRGTVHWVGDLFLELHDTTTRLTSADETSIPMGLWRVHYLQRGDIITGPFNLKKSHADIGHFGGISTQRYELVRIETLGGTCIPLNKSVGDHLTLELMEWP